MKEKINQKFENIEHGAKQKYGDSSIINYYKHIAEMTISSNEAATIVKTRKAHCKTIPNHILSIITARKTLINNMKKFDSNQIFLSNWKIITTFCQDDKEWNVGIESETMYRLLWERQRHTQILRGLLEEDQENQSTK